MSASNHTDGAGEMTARAWVTLSLRVIMGAYFLYSGGNKIWGDTGIHGFADAIGNYKLLPEAVVVPVAFFVPWAEIIAGLTLMLGVWRKGTILVMGGLVTGFIIFVSWAWKHQLVISCGCSGGDEPINYLIKAFELPTYLLVLAWLWLKGDEVPGIMDGRSEKKQNMARFPEFHG